MGVGGFLLDMEKFFWFSGGKGLEWVSGFGMGLGSGVEGNRKGAKGNDWREIESEGLYDKNI